MDMLKMQLLGDEPIKGRPWYGKCVCGYRSTATTRRGAANALADHQEFTHQRTVGTSGRNQDRET